MELLALPAFTDNYIWMLHDGVRALVVDDSATMRALIVSMLKRDPAIEVVGAAESAESARALIRQTDPDVQHGHDEKTAPHAEHPRDEAHDRTGDEGEQQLGGSQALRQHGDRG